MTSQPVHAEIQVFFSFSFSCTSQDFFRLWCKQAWQSRKADCMRCMGLKLTLFLSHMTSMACRRKISLRSTSVRLCFFVITSHTHTCLHMHAHTHTLVPEIHTHAHTSLVQVCTHTHTHTSGLRNTHTHTHTQCIHTPTHQPRNVKG